MIRILVIILFVSFAPLYAGAQERVFEKYCNLGDYNDAQRETHIVVDAALITAEAGPPLEENRIWRQQITRLLNVSEQGALTRWAARERVTVSVSEGNGAGLRPLFTGCVPLYTATEERELSASTTTVQRWTGTDWRSKLEDDVDDFRRSLTFSLVAGIKDITPATDVSLLSESGLGLALARGYRPTFQYGVPRLIIMTDLSQYDFPDSAVPDVKSTARSHALAWGGDLGRTEVHLLGAGGNVGPAQQEYLNSFFLTAKGDLKTTTSISGALLASNPPETVGIYQGTITYPDGDYPVTMRLALDSNRRAINSWIEVQSDELRFVPFEGALACESPSQCSFLEAGDFAQIWTDSPQGEAEFESWMPFVGFRDMKFTLEDGRIAGHISDSSGFVPGMEEGLSFTLSEVENGAF